MTTEIIIALIGIASSIITFFLTRKKYNTEVDSQQIKNMNDSFDVYKKMMEKALDSQRIMMENTINAQNETIKSQNLKIDALQKENDNLREQIGHLQMQLIKFFGNKFTVVDSENEN